MFDLKVLLELTRTQFDKHLLANMLRSTNYIKAAYKALNRTQLLVRFSMKLFEGPFLPQSNTFFPDIPVQPDPFSHPGYACVTVKVSFIDFVTVFFQTLII